MSANSVALLKLSVQVTHTRHVAATCCADVCTHTTTKVPTHPEKSGFFGLIGKLLEFCQHLCVGPLVHCW